MLNKAVRKQIEAGLRQYIIPVNEIKKETSRPTRCNPHTDPLIVLDFDCHRERPPGLGMRVVRDNDFILKNKGKADAINVQIEDIILTTGVAQFNRVTEIAAGAEIAVKTTIQKMRL